MLPTILSMKFSIALLLAVWPVVCLSLAAGEGKPANPQVLCRMAGIQRNHDQQGDRPVYEWGMILEVTPPSGWKLGWCEEGRHGITVESVGGGKAPGVSVSEDMMGGIEIKTPRWLPPVGSDGVRVKGELAVGVFREKAVAAPVTVKLEEGFAVPIVLPGAGVIDGNGKARDVKAKLVVKAYESRQKRLMLQLEAGEPMGDMVVDLQTMNDDPVPRTFDDYERNVLKNRYCWTWTYEVKEVKDETIKVILTYAKEPRPVSAAVDLNVALSGFPVGPMQQNQEP